MEKLPQDIIDNVLSPYLEYKIAYKVSAYDPILDRLKFEEINESEDCRDFPKVKKEYVYSKNDAKSDWVISIRHQNKQFQGEKYNVRNERKRSMIPYHGFTGCCNLDDYGESYSTCCKCFESFRVICYRQIYCSTCRLSELFEKVSKLTEKLELLELAQ